MGLLQIRQALDHIPDEDNNDDEVIFISHLTETHIPVPMTTMMMTYLGQTLSTRDQFVGSIICRPSKVDILQRQVSHQS